MQTSGCSLLKLAGIIIMSVFLLLGSCGRSELERPVEIAEVGVQPEAGTFGTFINRLRP